MKRNKIFMCLILTLSLVLSVCSLGVFAEVPAEKAIFVTNDHNIGWQINAKGNYYDIGNDTNLMVGGLMQNVVSLTDKYPTGGHVPEGNSRSSILAKAPAGDYVQTSIITTNPSYGVWDANIADLTEYGDNRAVYFYMFIYSDAQAVGEDFKGKLSFQFADFVDTYASNMGNPRWGNVSFGTWNGNTPTNGQWNRMTIKLKDVAIPAWPWAKVENADGLKKFVGIGANIKATSGNLTVLMNDVMATSADETNINDKVAPTFDFVKPTIDLTDIPEVVDEDIAVNLTPTITDEATSTSHTTSLVIKQGENIITTLSTAETIASYIFTEAGAYTLEYCVTDNYGVANTAIKDIVVNQVGEIDTAPPTVTVSGIKNNVNMNMAVSLKPNIIDNSDCSAIITIKKGSEVINTKTIASTKNAIDSDYNYTFLKDGDYVIEFAVKDEHNNTAATVIKNIKVIDNSVKQAFSNMNIENYTYPSSASINASAKKYEIGGTWQDMIYSAGGEIASQITWATGASLDHTKPGSINLIEKVGKEFGAFEFYIYYEGTVSSNVSFMLSTRSDQYFTDPAIGAKLPSVKLDGKIESNKYQRVIVRLTDLEVGTGADGKVLELIHLLKLQIDTPNSKFMLSKVNLIKTAEETGVYDKMDFVPNLTEPTFSLDNITNGNLMEGEIKNKFDLLPTSISADPFNIKLVIKKGTEEIVLTDVAKIIDYEFLSSGNWNLTYTISDENLNSTTLTKNISIFGAPDFDLPTLNSTYENENFDINVSNIVVDTGKTAKVYASWTGKAEFEITAETKLQKFVKGTHTISYRVTDGTNETVKAFTLNSVEKKEIVFENINTDTKFDARSTHAVPHLGNRQISPVENAYSSIFIDNSTNNSSKYIGFEFVLNDKISLSNLTSGYEALTFWFYKENADDYGSGNFTLRNEKDGQDYYQWTFASLNLEVGKWNKVVLKLADATKSGFPTNEFFVFSAWGTRADSGKATVMISNLTFINSLINSGVEETQDAPAKLGFVNPTISIDTSLIGGAFDKQGGYNLVPTTISTVNDADYKGILNIKRKDGSVFSTINFTKENIQTVLATYAFTTGNEYVLEYEIIDEFYNSNKALSSIIITGEPIDTTKPVITIGEFEEEIYNSTVVDFASIISVTDNKDGDLKSKTVITIYNGTTLKATISAETADKTHKFMGAGGYVVKFNVTDLAGNKADEKQLEISVVKKTETLPTVVIGKINDSDIKSEYFMDNTIVLSGIVAKDAFDNVLEFTIIVTNAKGNIAVDKFNSFTITEYGTYKIVVSAIDEDGNEGKKEISFEVKQQKTEETSKKCGSAITGSFMFGFSILLVAMIVFSIKTKKKPN